MEKNKQGSDEFLKSNHEKYGTYIIEQTELLESKMKSVIELDFLH